MNFIRETRNHQARNTVAVWKSRGSTGTRDLSDHSQIAYHTKYISNQYTNGTNLFVRRIYSW